MPKAYLIAQLDICDPDTYDQYRAHTPDSIAEYGGRFVVRGGASEHL